MVRFEFFQLKSRNLTLPGWAKQRLSNLRQSLSGFHTIPFVWMCEERYFAAMVWQKNVKAVFYIYCLHIKHNCKTSRGVIKQVLYLLAYRDRQLQPCRDSTMSAGVQHRNA